tara:strand:+ start:11786 stop:11980 length:195 start_codon:yes stop_codon:yes gene_type:complete
MKKVIITESEIAILEMLYKSWAALEASEDKLDSSKAIVISSTICSALPKLLAEVRRCKESENEK